MSHPLSRVPILGKFVDERFLEHRRRSTSVAGIVGALAAGGIFEYRLLVQHVESWDLFAVLAAMVATKLGMMLWYRMRD
ncbi:MAG TPA: hypothetical protein VK716_14740 [Terracidiphilus sp.]|jgi:hypothetical protein|nr:hypothetical protein [Terracidiphilus sp.]